MVLAKVSEIFLSLQGEGKYLGQEQCFVRFYGCNMRCDFCDTKPETFKEYSTEQLLKQIRDTIGDSSVKSISLTGGEPLLYRDILLEVLPKLKSEGFQIYLETNGILCDELFDMIDYIDVIAMDIKLPSSTKDKEKWSEHERFLNLAIKKEVFVKLVICKDTTLVDIKKAVEMVLRINPSVTFVLQPNSRQLGRELAEKLYEFKSYSKQFNDVRIIPQLHSIMGIR